jgi:hypothetical protein
MDYHEREKLKRQGHEVYRHGHSKSERAQGLFMIIEGYFYGNLESPSFSEYAAHWLCASAGKYDEEAMASLVRRFPKPKRLRIQPGFSDWDSFGKPNYRIEAPQISTNNAA